MLINGIYDSDLELSLVGKVQSDKWSYGAPMNGRK